MSSPDRPRQSRDRPSSEDAARHRGTAGTQDAPIRPPQYFDPGEPWDAQSAEALTRLYESGEGYLHRRPGDQDAWRGQARRVQPSGEQSAGEPADRDRAWLEARLAEIAERLQGSLASINPDKAVASLNSRLDAIEERFKEALSGVVQRSDMEGLKLIEAHVMELAAHVEQTRSRLDRIDAIDDQMQGLVRKLEDGDHQRLDALEKLLHDYIAEWRRGDERTANALHKLEEVVAQVGESIESMEAQKPAPDLSPLSLFGAPGLSEPANRSDPLSQVYTDAVRTLEGPVSPLDAADYVPKPEADVEPPPQLEPAETLEAIPDGGSPLPSPSSLALAMRARMRQPQIPAPEDAPDHDTAEGAPAGREQRRADPAARRRSWSSFLLAGGVTLFAAIGYLLVDVFMTTSAAPRRPAAIELSAQPAGDARTEQAAPPEDNATAPGETQSSTREHADGASPQLRRDFPHEDAPGPASTAARIDAIGSVMAAVFRRGEDTARPAIAATASIQKDAYFEPPSPSPSTLPMAIGPASLRQAALRGEAAAQLEVGARFAAGQGVKQDAREAFHWYGRAAAQGLAVAQYRYAALYERGLGTARDAERARVWYARAAEQGNVKAMHNLAVLSVSGGRSDYATAAKWFAQAADLGLTDSQVNLAILYQNGLGVPKDMTQAYKWLELAGRAGDREAARRVSELKARLGLAELEAADALIASWHARTPDAGANEGTPAAAALGISR